MTLQSDSPAPEGQCNAWEPSFSISVSILTRP